MPCEIRAKADMPCTTRDNRCDRFLGLIATLSRFDRYFVGGAGAGARSEFQMSRVYSHTPFVRRCTER